MRLIVFIISFLLVVPAFGQKTKKKEDGTEGQVSTEGIVYALPRTGIRVILKATCTWFDSGPYAQYAEQLLGLSNVKTVNSTSWTLNDIAIETFPEPDPEKTFKSVGDIASLLNLSPSGCLAGINTENAQIVTEKLVAGNFIKDRMDGPVVVFDNLTETSWYYQGDSTTNYRIMRITPEKKAAEVAARILECRKNRYEIAAGLLDEFHPDGKAYEVSLKELEQIEKEYVSLFTGKSRKKQYTFSFDYVPSSKPVKGEVLFRFNEERGVLPSSDLSGKPVMIEIQSVELASDLKSLTTSADPSAGGSGIFYRIPGIAEIKIIQELQVILAARIILPQFGMVAPVPEELLEGSYSLEFHPETGAIKNILKK